jgi:16S rRNA (cytosine967-C5)-methyltransferase
MGKKRSAPTERIDAQPHATKRLGRTHDRILEVYGQISTGIPADVALKATFKRARDLGSSERHEVSDTIYGLMRSERRIDDLLHRALKAEGKTLETLDPPIVLRMRLLAYFAANGVPVETLQARDAYAFRRVPKVLERIASDRLPPVKRSAVESLAVSQSFPTWFIERLGARFGEVRAEEIARALNLRAPITVRVNTLVATREEAKRAIEEELGVTATPTIHSPYGLILSGPADIQASKLFDRGMVEMQDEGSQLITLATGASPKETVLDACAGAGGKTLLLAAMMENKGHLFSVDPDAKKLELEKRRARRATITSVETIASDLESIDKRFREAFDRVLVDAPCTGTGALRRHPDARRRLSLADLDTHVERQRRLLTSAVQALRSGGVLAYATCSVLWEENEGLIEDVLANEPRLDPLPLRTTWGDPLADALGAAGHQIRIGPGPTETDPDGFFVALMRKR